MAINRTSDALWRGPAVAEVEPKRVAVSPERWQLLVRHFDGLGPGKAADLQLSTMTIAEPLEIDGVTFLPAVYFLA